MKWRLLPILLAGLASAAPAGAVATSVTQVELDAFVAGADAGNPEVLKALFGKRMMRSTTWVDHDLATPKAFLKTIEGCRRHRITRFPDAPDVFVQWVCPGRPHQGPKNTLPGYVARLWHHGELGLSLGFAQDEIPVGPLMAPPGPRN